jgi:AraC-like DNA-binding protein
MTTQVHKDIKKANGLARIAADRHPVLELVQTEASESFLWRHDDYPCEFAAWNIHAEHEIHLITNASGVALVGDHIGRFEPGHFCIVGGGLPHDWVAELAPGEVIAKRDVVLQFSAERLRRSAAFLPELGEIDRFFTLSLRGLDFHGETRRRAAELLPRIGTVHGVERLALFFQLLALLARSDEYTVLSSSDFVANLDPATLTLIDRAQSYIFEHIKTDIRLSDVADLVGMQESAFSRFFKKNSGNSFTDYVTKLRMSLACRLLADSNAAITDICFDVGYTNISNFNRLFRKTRGVTPSSYRRLASQHMLSRGAGLPEAKASSGQSTLR